MLEQNHVINLYSLTMLVVTDNQNMTLCSLVAITLRLYSVLKIKIIKTLSQLILGQQANDEINQIKQHELLRKSLVKTINRCSRNSMSYIYIYSRLKLPGDSYN